MKFGTHTERKSLNPKNAIRKWDAILKVCCRRHHENQCIVVSYQVIKKKQQIITGKNGKAL
jgi:hypothetical protein